MWEPNCGSAASLFCGSQSQLGAYCFVSVKSETKFLHVLVETVYAGRALFACILLYAGERNNKISAGID